MIITEQGSKVNNLLKLFPGKLSLEIERLAMGRVGGFSRIKEISLNLSGMSSLLIGDERIRLFYKIERGEIEDILRGVCDGALYAHRDSIAKGFVSLEGGIRVGVCGRASYDGGSLVGVSSVSSLLFRIPTGECAFSDELYRIFNTGVGSGMLIFSPPGVGKTTALRSLAYSLGGGVRPMRVAIVDERFEFYEDDYVGRQVDILKGYKRSEGVEIAVRTLSPEVIFIDEIGIEESRALLGAVRCGVPIVATAHASSIEEVLNKPSLSSLFDCSAFGLLVGISKEGGSYSLSIHRL